MSQTTPLFGYSAPTRDDPLDADAMAGHLDSIATAVRAGSAVEAAQRVQPVMHPALVLRTDNDTVWLYSDEYPTGDQIAGRGHGAQWNGSRPASANQALTAIDVKGFTHASTGWRMGDDAYSVRVPATGMYLLSVRANMAGTTYSGRSFIEARINDTVLCRFPGHGDNDWAGSTLAILSEGDQIKMVSWQASGTARDISCVVIAAQVNNPAWAVL